MITLDAVTKSLEVKLGGAVAATQCPLTAAWTDITTTTFAPGETDTVTNGATAVTLVAAPAAATQRQIELLTIYNADSATVVATVQLNNAGTKRILFSATLPTLYQLQYTKGEGFRVFDQNGAVQGTGAAGAAGAPGAAGATGRQGAHGKDGEDGVDGMPIPGRPGTPGAAGATGAAGTNGRTGAPGRTGEDGEDGVALPGPRGAAGAAGTPGSTGATGRQGPPGRAEDGVDGIALPGRRGAASTVAGPTGPDGLPGLDGQDGAPGTPGVDAILDDTGVVAGSYTNTDLTVDSTGRITAASSGAGGSEAAANKMLRALAFG